MDSGKWYRAEAGDVVWGQLVGEEIVVRGMHSGEFNEEK